MSERIIAKIQNRMGLRLNLPQPLDPGEIGLCLDTGQVFIGADPSDVNSFITPSVELFVPSVNTNNLANIVINEQVAQINLASNPETEEEVKTLLESISAIDNVDIQYIHIVSDIVSRVYIGYLNTPLRDTDNNDTGFDIIETYSDFGQCDWLGKITSTIGVNKFINGTLVLGLPYINLDAGVISTLINNVYNKGQSNGLVTVKQNIELFTEHSYFIKADTFMEPIEFRLSKSDDFVDTGVYYYIEKSDVFDIEYSARSNNSNFVSTGKFTIVADNTSTTSNLTEYSTSINPNSETLNFIAVVEQDIALSLNRVKVQYKSSVDVVFRTLTKRWKSF